MCFAINTYYDRDVADTVGAGNRVEVDCLFIVAHDVSIYSTRPNVSSNLTVRGVK